MDENQKNQKMIQKTKKKKIRKKKMRKKKMRKKENEKPDDTPTPEGNA